MAKKIYAVRKGRKSGIYTSWADCQQQVKGFPGARFKGFTNLEEAMRWLSGIETRTSTPTRRTRKPASRYAEPAGPEDADYIIYTDGSCLRNPAGPGGWAMVACDTTTGEVTERSGGEASTTNNRMELTAAREALRFAPTGTKVALYTDSQYLKNGITKWIFSWKKRGWKKADGTPVLNQELWQDLDRLYQQHQVTFHWVKGHAGIDLNERCDQLAKKEAQKYAL